PLPLKMFTTRICCCSATVASQTMAVVAIILAALLAIPGWFADDSLLVDNIILSILVCVQVLACVLVFVACCTLNAGFMIPIIVIQSLSVLSYIGTAIWFLIVAIGSTGVWNWAFVSDSVLYIITIIISLFVLHCHTCCYKLLLVKAHLVRHHVSA
ncbi:hypothetical protein PFISCL1PPCAC_13098, partial [Pristionchus fissidentatus]